MAELAYTQTGVSYDNLIGGTAITMMTANVEIEKLATKGVLKRGTLLGKKTDGGFAIVDSSVATGEQVASVVLAHDVEVGTEANVVATVYTRGLFNRSALIVKQEADSATKHEEELRKVGIYLTDAQ
ncbi:MAG: head decoration protein [Phascolarctobacterium sp.]